ncbi:unnamed protein product, partial [Hapterophycus canaliculatus]
MLREEAEYPSQSAMTYLRRVLKCSLLLAFTTPLLYGVIIRTLGLLGIEHDEVVMKLSKGFPKKGLLRAIRHRASVPLLQMLAWRISRYSTEGVEVRLRHCHRMLSVLETALARPRRHQRQQLPPPPPPLASLERGARGVGDVLPGIKAHRHTLWLFPVMVEGGPHRAGRVVKALLGEGFDATRAPTSLMPIDRTATLLTLVVAVFAAAQRVVMFDTEMFGDDGLFGLSAVGQQRPRLRGGQDGARSREGIASEQLFGAVRARTARCKGSSSYSRPRWSAQGGRGGQQRAQRGGAKSGGLRFAPGRDRGVDCVLGVDDCTDHGTG